MNLLNAVNDFMWNYILIALLLLAAVYFTVRTRGVQFVMVKEMVRLLARSGKRDNDRRGDTLGDGRSVSSFQAFAVSIASRVGTGNIAGVATAIAIGGPGSVFWMWVIAILGSANAFIESTLAQLYKIKGRDSYMGGPAYYIKYGIGSNWYAILFAVLISVTFGLAYNSVQSNTIAAATLAEFGWSTTVTGAVLTVLSLVIICGGIQRISRFSEIVVPVMAILYILLAVVIIGMNITQIPEVLRTIVSEAFDFSSAAGGGIGMAILMGVKRGLFSNEAGEGSAPNVAATAAVSHPVKQGLLQTLAVYTDTLIVCTCTAFIILCSGVYDNGNSGIELTQNALQHEVGSVGSVFVTIAIFLFAFTSIVGNYYYGETNMQFISRKKWVLPVYRVAVGAMVMIGAVSQLDFVWALADITMGLMTTCNIVAIVILGRYAVILLHDYRRQRLKGYEPTYQSDTIPDIADKTRCWD